MQRPGKRGIRRSSPRSDGGRPRLLLVTPDFPPAHGGIQLLAHRLAVGIEAFETRVLTLRCDAQHDGDGQDDGDGADNGDATTVRTRRVAARGPHALRHASLNAAAVGEALRYRPQAVLSVHIVASPASAAIRRALGARTVQYFHAKEIGNRPRLAAFAARQADASIAVSAYTAGLIAACAGPGVAPRLIPPGVDLPAAQGATVGGAPPARGFDGSAPARGFADSAAARAFPGPAAPAHARAGADRAGAPPAARPTLLTISRLEDRYKGHDVMLRALAIVRERVPDVEWVVIGEGPLRPELERLAHASGVADAVRFLGAVDDEQRDRWLRDADLLAMPSRLPGDGRAGEGFGIVYMEAAAHGKPVLAGNVGGALDAVRDGETGLLVDPADHRAVAEAVERLLCDGALARRLGEAGARRARDFAWPRIAQRVQAVLAGEEE